MKKSYYFLCRGWDENDHILEDIFYRVAASSNLLDFLHFCGLTLMSEAHSSGRYMMTEDFTLPGNLSPEMLVQQFSQNLFEMCKTDQTLLESLYFLGGDIELNEMSGINSWSIWPSYEFDQLKRERFS